MEIITIHGKSIISEIILYHWDNRDLDPWVDNRGDNRDPFLKNKRVDLLVFFVRLIFPLSKILSFDIFSTCLILFLCDIFFTCLICQLCDIFFACSIFQLCDIFSTCSILCDISPTSIASTWDNRGWALDNRDPGSQGTWAPRRAAFSRIQLFSDFFKI